MNGTSIGFRMRPVGFETC